MTVSSTSSRIIYAGNGTTMTWPFAFQVNQAADLAVIYTDTAGTDNPLSPSVYSVTGLGLPNGGAVTYPLTGSAIAANTKLTIQRSVALTQPSSISNQSAMWPTVIEAALDRLTYMAQTVADAVSRALVISPTDGNALNGLPNATTRANSVLGFDQNGQPVATTLMGNILSVASWLVQNFFTAATSAANACTALGAAFLTGNNAFSGNNTFSGTNTITGTEDFTAGRIKVPTRTMGDAGTDAASSAFVANAIAAAAAPQSRQTVLGGPVTAAGLPNFLPASAAGLVLAEQNIAPATPFACTAANSVGVNGQPVNLAGVSVANQSWTLPDNSTSYLYKTIAANGALTVGSTTLAPIYQWGGVPSTVAGQFTFNIGEMRGYLGNGTTAPQAFAVFVGQAVTAGGAIANATPYAYNGQYDSGYTQTLPITGNSATSKNHNIGVIPRVANFLIQCTTAEQGYLVGDELGPPLLYTNDGTTNVPFGVSVSTLTVTISVQSIFAINNKTTGGRVAATNTNWKYRFVAQRGW